MATFFSVSVLAEGWVSPGLAKLASTLPRNIPLHSMTAFHPCDSPVPSHANRTLSIIRPSRESWRVKSAAPGWRCSQVKPNPLFPQSPISYLSKVMPGVSIFFRCRTLKVVWKSSLGLPEYIHSWFLNSVRHLCQSLMPTLRASAPHICWLVPADLHKNLELRSSGIVDSGSGSSPIPASTLSALPEDKDNSVWGFLFCFVFCNRASFM